MNELRVFLFGDVRILRDRSGAEVQLPRGAEALLSYLLLGRKRRFPRDSLGALFWADLSQERARGALSTTLWRLRRALESDGCRGRYLQTSPTGDIGFNENAEYWLDVEVLESVITESLGRPAQEMDSAQTRRLEAVLDLYTGELMEGFFDDWVTSERDRLKVVYLAGMTHLMRAHRNGGALEKAMACGQKILETEPLREEIHRDLMEMYATSGRRSFAVRQYESCRKVLASELGIAPMTETTAIYERIVPGNGAGPATSTRGSNNGVVAAPDVGDILRDLRGTVRDLDQVRVLLERAATAIERAQSAYETRAANADHAAGSEERH